MGILRHFKSKALNNHPENGRCYGILYVEVCGEVGKE